MEAHVDVVQNEWLKGVQTRVAVVQADEGRVDVRPVDTKWDEVVRRPYLSQSAGGWLYADKEPEAFVEHLWEIMHGSYLYATELHKAGDCPFGDDDTITLFRS